MKQEEIRADLTGQTFGKLTVLRRVQELKRWICRCACGRELEVREIDLLRKSQKTCGLCTNRRESTANLAGKTFGKLTALRNVPGTRRWLCRCACGRELEVKESELLRNHKRTCGFCSRRKENVLARDVFSVCEIPKQEIYRLAKEEGLTFGECVAKQYILLTKGRRVENGIIREENA